MAKDRYAVFIKERNRSRGLCMRCHGVLRLPFRLGLFFQYDRDPDWKLIIG